jgi:hypothetical protein
VLVDAAHPDMGLRLLAALPPESSFESTAIKTWRRFLEFQWKANGRESQNEEGVDVQTGNQLVKATKPLGDLPLTVISRNPGSSGFPNMPPLPAETAARLSQIWQDMQTELMGLSTHSTRVMAAHAGHMIPAEEPQPIIDAIRGLVTEVRGRTGETPLALPTAGLGETEHTPVVRAITERTENEDGQLRMYRDIFFTDAAGDATTLTNKVVATSIPAAELIVLDDIITESADEQKREAQVTAIWGCGTPKQPYWIALEFRVLDLAGNLSEPVTAVVTCPATRRSTPLPVIGLVAGLGLLAAAVCLLVRSRRGNSGPAHRPKLEDS